MDFKLRAINHALLILYEHWHVLVMTQFTDFSAIQGQLLIPYCSNSDKMRNPPMCYGDMFHRILYISYLVMTSLTIFN